MTHDHEDAVSREQRRTVGAEAAEHILGPNPVVGVRSQDIFQTTGLLIMRAMMQPQLFFVHWLNFAAESAGIAGGFSRLEPDSKDRRFQDATWRENEIYRRTLQLYLAANHEMHEWVSDILLDEDERKRAHFLLDLLNDALAPSNSMLNPEALKRFLETGGMSSIHGLRHLLDDLQHNGGMPSQVDTSAFQVGKNLATTAGSVVFRGEVLELIHYQPVTETVSERPLLIVPPQINKFYVFDLSPQKSLVQYALSNGLQVFMISWRNPTPAQRDWGLETYVGAIEEASEVACAITGSPDCNLLGACSGGITTVTLVGYLAARQIRRVHALTLLVSVFDTGNHQTPLGLFASEEAIEAARRHSHVRGVLEGKEMARVFSWLRPNDLIWNYWVNNYLLGHEPPAFDVLYWNNDTTRLPAALHSEFLTIYQHNLLAQAKALIMQDIPIDVSQIKCDVYFLAGTTDHITPWQDCYRSSRLLGGQREFILSTSGHIQSILNPPGNPKASFFTNAGQPADAETWYAGATRHNGSWWEHWKTWMLARSGGQKAAPPAVGNKAYTPLADAPGTYVYD
jgi:polyhydroxyalkanoate synthase